MEEFLCNPIDSAMDFIPLELVLGCEVGTATIDFDYVRRAGQYAGFDVGRKRDLSNIWIISEEPDGHLTRGVIWMSRMKFSEQYEVAKQVAQCVDRMCVDETGLGAQIAEDLKTEFPDVVEPVTFTGPVKEALAVRGKTCLEERKIGLPEDRRIRRAFQSVKRFVTAAGNIRFDANRTDQGHADEFWAAMLALEAASGAPNYVPAEEVGPMGETTVGNLMERVF
jgi:phage FluMu gp28-like protein